MSIARLPRALHDVADIRGQPVLRGPSWRVLRSVHRARCLRPPGAAGCGGLRRRGCRSVRRGCHAVRRPKVRVLRRRVSRRPGRAPLRRLMCASAMRPMAVTLIVMPAAERVGVAPGERDAERFGEFPVAEHELFGPCAGRVGRERQRQQVATGRAHIEATSLRFTARDLRPSSRGEVAGRRKWTPSASMSVVKTSDSPSPTGSTAQSSPTLRTRCRQSGEEFFYVVYESEFGHGSRVCPAAAPRRPVRFSGFSRAAAAPGAESPPGDGERSLCEPRQGRGRRLKSLFNGRCRTKVLKIL